jgi:hypothetical protein
LKLFLQIHYRGITALVYGFDVDRATEAKRFRLDFIQLSIAGGHV